MEAQKTKQEENSQEKDGIWCKVKEGCLSTFVSLQEGLVYVKAFFVGQGKKLTARNEEEAAIAELETSKMQVEAANAAENAKKRINKA